MIENDILNRGFGGGTEDLTPDPFPSGKGSLFEKVNLNDESGGGKKT